MAGKVTCPECGLPTCYTCDPYCEHCGADLREHFEPVTRSCPIDYTVPKTTA